MSRRSLVTLAVTLLAGLSLTATSAWASPVVTRASGANPAAIQAAVDSFRSQLGTLNPNTPGSAASGRREINWDGVPDAFASPANLPFNFFNANSPRGVLFTTSSGANATTRVSASDASGNPRFRDIEPDYSARFSTFSPQRLFTSFSVPLNVVFRVPGTSIGAASSGFGAVFTSVTSPTSTFLQFFDANGRDLGTFFVPTSGVTGQSFLGVRFDAGEQVAFVRITPGNQVLAAGERDLANRDVVAMDDFIYGEPQALTTGEESFENGFGGFTPSLPVSLPGDQPPTLVTTDQHAGVRSVFFAEPSHATDATLTSSPVAIRSGGPSTLTFFQRSNAENSFDGGVVETSTDNGASWQRVEPAQYLENPPTARLSRSFRNPLIDPAADVFIFTGTSIGFQRTIVDLSQFAGRTIVYRFRFASDISVSGGGWFIDDVAVATPPAPQPQPQPQPQPRPAPALAISSLKLTPAAFRAAGSGATIAVRRGARRGRRARGPIGSTLSFTLSRSATVTFTLAREARGRRQGGVCKKPSRRNRRGRACVRLVTVRGSFSTTGAAGSNSRRFSGRVNGRKLSKGSYRMTATATSGTEGKAATTTFRILRG